jgi:hypothetical protein
VGAALRELLDKPGCLITLASASLLVGREATERAASIFYDALSQIKLEAERRHIELAIADTDADKAQSWQGFDAFREIFIKGRLGVRIVHAGGIESRLLVVAPNPATARGYSGTVIIDEIGWIHDFKDLWDAMIYIASRQSDFRLILSTTPPDDDAHFSYELLIPPSGLEFKINPKGNWYVSEAGILVHRLDAWDAHAGGLFLLDDESGMPLNPEQHRTQAVDKTSWDRNLALRFIAGGASAVQRLWLDWAQTNGADKGQAIELDISRDDWRKIFDDMAFDLPNRLGSGPIGLGLDIATTEKQKSHPSAICILEKAGDDYVARLLMRWKTKEPDITTAIVTGLVEAVTKRKQGGRPKRLCVDSTSERFYAADLRRRLGRSVSVELINASETLNWRGQEMTFKTYLGKQLVDCIADSHLLLPQGEWLRQDWRLVKDDRGSFVNEVDSAGNHADTFDAAKLALHGLMGRGSGAPIVNTSLRIGSLQPLGRRL